MHGCFSPLVFRVGLLLYAQIFRHFFLSEVVFLPAADNARRDKGVVGEAVFCGLHFFAPFRRVSPETGGAAGALKNFGETDLLCT